MARFQIDFKSGKAVYLQLVEQVKVAAACGAVRPGEALPPIRPLAEELRVNRNTVARAYAELEREGIIHTVVGRGSFIAANHSPLKKEVRRRLLAGILDGAVVHAHHMQISKAEFLRLAEERFDDVARQRKEAEEA